MIKRLLLALVLLVAIVAGSGLAYVFLALPDVPPSENVRIDATPERIARGEYLFNHVAMCADCHSTRDWSKYAAPIVPGTIGMGGEPFTPELMPGLPGSLYARNITPAAVGDWTDGELMRTITTGVNKHGTPLFPLMPYPAYGSLDRDDVEAIVAYMRTLAPIANEVPDRSLHFPMPLIVRTIPRAASFQERPPASDKAAYGAYVVRAAACVECHTPRDAQGQPLPGRDFAGGMEFRFPAGGVVRSANLTPDADTGIGTWTEQQFVDKFRAFSGAPARTLSPAEQRENTVMPWLPYSGMTDEDLRAVYAHLRTLPPVVHRVAKHDTSPTVSR